MPTTGTNYITLQDLKKNMGRENGGEAIASIIEILSQTQSLCNDLSMHECNDGTHEKAHIRNGLPTWAWKIINRGTPVSKSDTTEVTFTTGKIESAWKVDHELSLYAPSLDEFLFNETLAHLQSIRIGAEHNFFYGNQTINKEGITGITPYYSSLSSKNAKNIINAGGLGSDNTSIWLVVHGKNSVYGIYPKGQKSGLNMTKSNDGKPIYTENLGGEGRAGQIYAGFYNWALGLVVKDWRACVRICNIDVSDFMTAGDSSSSAPNIIKYMTLAKRRIPTDVMSLGKPVFYINNDLLGYLEVLAVEKRIATLTLSDIYNGMPELRIGGIPVRGTDALMSTESRVV